MEAALILATIGEVSIAAGRESSVVPLRDQLRARMEWRHAGVPGKKEAVSSSTTGKLPLLISCLLGCRQCTKLRAVCITRRMESRVTIPTIWGAPSLEPLTTGI